MSEKMYCRASYNKMVCDQIIAYIMAVSKFRLFRVFNHSRVMLCDDNLETIIVVTCPIEEGVGAIVTTFSGGDDLDPEIFSGCEKYFNLLSFANYWSFDKEVYDSIINTGEFNGKE